MKLHATYILEIRLVETVLELVYYTEWQRKYLNSYVLSSAVGGKTGKTSGLTGFSKIERGGGSGGALHCYGGLI